MPLICFDLSNGSADPRGHPPRLCKNSARLAEPNTVAAKRGCGMEWSWECGRTARYIGGATPFPTATSRVSSPGSVHTTTADPNETVDLTVDSKRIRQSARAMRP